MITTDTTEPLKTIYLYTMSEISALNSGISPESYADIGTQPCIAFLPLIDSASAQFGGYFKLCLECFQDFPPEKI